jgi:DHA1 family tetracycline resistance protein-like MFS transporter
MMFVVIALNLLGFTAIIAVQSLVSGAADEREQGRTMGSVASLNSLMGVVAPVIAAALLGLVANLPQGDMRIGLPFFFCALLQGAATVVALRHFQRARSASLIHPTPLR